MLLLMCTMGQEERSSFLGEVYKHSDSTQYTKLRFVL